MINSAHHIKPFRLLKCTVLASILLMLATSAGAQKQAVREYQIKAIFLFNFTQFVEWNPASFSEGQFVIGILGPDPFGSFIDETIAGEKVGGKPIVVHRYRDINDVRHCHILFINTGGYSNEMLTALRKRSILTVSDQAQFASQGGMIRFYTEKNKIRLQINRTAAKAAGLQISSKLLRLADIVD